MKIAMTPAALAAAAKGDIENAIVASTPGGIEAQEKRGQTNLTRQFDQLPKDGPRDDAIALGFKFGDDVDDIFVSVTPPEGWELRPSDHSMWSYIHDEKGRKRGSVFYKAAFYDRNAHFSFAPRYSIYPEFKDGYKSRRTVARDCEVVIKDWPWIGEGKYGEQDAQEKEAEAWLLATYPDCRNVKAYWDTP